MGRLDAVDMLLKYAKKRQAYDASGYPQDTQATILLVCEHWQIPPPRYKKDKGYWIEGARRLQDACGEFGGEMITAFRQEYVKQTLERKALGKYPEIPFTVEGPTSLIKAVRAFAGLVREKANGDAESEDRERYKYIRGQFADFVEH